MYQVAVIEDFDDIDDISENFEIDFDLLGDFSNLMYIPERKSVLIFGRGFEIIEF